MDYNPQYNSPCRGIVVFKDATCLLWAHEDGNQVVAWAKHFDSKPHSHTAAHGGVQHAIVWMRINAEVIYERE